MHAKSGLFCDKVIEAGWLAAAIVAPLFFNIYRKRVFEASKVTLLRSIVLVMLGAWLIKLLEAELGKGQHKGKRRGELILVFVRTPLVIPTLLVATVCILTTVTSVVPRTSFWGSYERRQGVYATLCFIAIFLVTLQNLRSRQQLERLIIVILLTSFPVSVYGIMQHYGLEPSAWVRGGGGRVQSTLGNPIFIGAYLVMVIPITLGRLIERLSVIRAEKSPRSFALMGCYLLLLAFQLTCLLFTQSRGPVMGLMAGLFFFFLLLAIFSGRKGLVLTVIGLAIIVVLFLVILNLPNSPLGRIKEMPYIGRLGRMLEIASGTGRERVLIWQGAIELIAADPLRAVIGYGPDSMCVTFNRYLSAELADLLGPGRTADRCHNETLDVLATTGLIGLGAYLLLFGGVFYYGLRGLGLIGNRWQRVTLFALWLAGASWGVLAPYLLEGTLKFAAVGLPLGLTVGMGVYLVAHVFLFPDAGRRTTEGWRQTLLVALLSALVAHFVEIQFGIAIATTRTYFWLYAALLIIVGYLLQKEPFPGDITLRSPTATSRQAGGRGRGERKRIRRPRSSLVSTPASRSVISYSLAVGLILVTIGFDFVVPDFDLRDNGPVVFGLFFAVWVLSGLIVTAEASGQGGEAPRSLTFLVASLSWVLPFIVVHAALVFPGTSIERVTVFYYAYLLLAILAIAASMVGAPLLALWRRRTCWLYPIVGIAIISLVTITNLNVAKADIYYKFGLAAEGSGRMDEAIAAYRQAVNMAPHVDRYRLSLGWAYGLKAVAASDASQRLAWFEESRNTLKQARQMNPLDPDFAANLGHLYANWGTVSSDSGQRARKWEMALICYQEAAALSPQNHGRRLKGDMIRTYLHLADSYAAMGRLGQAAAVYKGASKVAPDDYVIHNNLAIIYQQLARIEEALAEAKTARELAPAEETEKLEALIAELEAQKP